MGFSKWTPEINLKFIKLYREQEVLWRTDSAIYRDRDARHEALRYIINGMNLPDLNLEDVKKKIKYLRCTYMVEVNKIEKSLQTGKIYKPCLSWFHEMDSFIKYVTAKRKIPIAILQSDSQNYSDTQAVTETNWLETSVVKTEAGIRHEEEKLEDVEEEQPDQSSSNKEQARRSILPIRSKRNRFRQLHSVVKDIKNISEKLVQQQKKPNSYEAFGNYIGIQLQSLLEEDAIVAQEEIHSIITRYKLKKIRYSNEHYSVASTPISNCSNNSQPEYHFHVSPSRHKNAGSHVEDYNENAETAD